MSAVIGFGQGKTMVSIGRRKFAAQFFLQILVAQLFAPQLFGLVQILRVGRVAAVDRQPVVAGELEFVLLQQFVHVRVVLLEAFDEALVDFKRRRQVGGPLAADRVAGRDWSGNARTRRCPIAGNFPGAGPAFRGSRQKTFRTSPRPAAAASNDRFSSRRRGDVGDVPVVRARHQRRGRCWWRSGRPGGKSRTTRAGRCNDGRFNSDDA